MNLTSNFVEVQTCIELLFVLSYFIVSLYFPFIIFVDKSLPGKSRELVKSMGYLFSFITVILVVRLMVEFLHPGNEIIHGAILTLLGLMVITSPVRKYVCSKISVNICSARVSFIKAATATTLYLSIVLFDVQGIMVSQTIDKIFTAVLVLLFLSESISIIIKVIKGIINALDCDRIRIARLKHDLFLSIIEAMISISILFFLFTGFNDIYVWSASTLLLLFNGYVVFVTCSYSSVDEKEAAVKNSINESEEQLSDDKNRIIRGLSDKAKADELYKRLLIYFEQKKPYLQQDLKIREVALYLYSNKTYLSRIINDRHNLNFNQFVNYYRIEEVKRLFKENPTFSIQELCTRSGFGSMATFSIAFRYHLGNTPADWCKEQRLLKEHE